MAQVTEINPDLESGNFEASLADLCSPEIFGFCYHNYCSKSSFNAGIYICRNS